MPIDTATPGSPGWWLDTLATKLHDRRAGRAGNKRFTRRTIEPSRIRPGLMLLQDYLDGDPPLREDIHSGWAEPFRQFLRMGRMNIAPKLVSATANRMTIRDFRTSAADDELGDVSARDLMRHNGMVVKSREVHDYMLGLGDGYTIVTPPDATRDWSLITAESPLHCITAHDPMTGVEIAGLKMFRDEDLEVDYAYLFLPGEVWVARCEAPTTTLFRNRWVISDRWEWDEEKFDDVPADRVAMVRFQNKGGKSELEGYLDDLDRINDKLFNEWWVGKIQAFRQRALQQAAEDEAGNPVAAEDEDGDGEISAEELAGIFTSAPDAMWLLPPGAKIWESSTADIRQLTESIKAELQWLAFTKSKPLYLITPDAANGSAEGASTQREEHAFDVLDRIARASDSWARTLAMAFEFQGDADRADVTKIEPIWGPVERYSLAEMADAGPKFKSSGYPVEAIMTDVFQRPPADVVDRLRPLRGRDLLYGAAPAGPAIPAAPVVPAAAQQPAPE